MKTLYVSLFLTFVLFVLGLRLAPKYCIGSIVFFIPLASRSVIVGGFKISFVSMFIFAYLMSYLIMMHAKGMRRIDKTLIPHKKYLLLILLALAGSLFDFLMTGVPISVVEAGPSLTKSVTMFLTNTLAGMVLYWMVCLEARSFDDILFFLRAFCFSLLFLLGVLFILNVLNINLPDFVKPLSYSEVGPDQDIVLRGSLRSIYDRIYFTGFHGFIEEFCEYLFLLLVFGFTLLTNKTESKKLDKAIGALCILSSVGLSIPTGSKSFVFMAAIFFFLYFLFANDIKQRIIVLFLTAAIAIVALLSVNIFIETWLYQRFAMAYRIRVGALYYEGLFNAFPILVGRVDLWEAIPWAIAAGGPFGGCPFVVLLLNNSQIPFQNLWYALYLNMGILGLVVMSFFFGRIIIDLYRRYRIASGDASHLSFIFLVTFAILLLEQIKVTSFRIAPGMLTWWFLFGIFAAVTRFGLVERLNEKA